MKILDYIREHHTNGQQRYGQAIMNWQRLFAPDIDTDGLPDIWEIDSYHDARVSLWWEVIYEHLKEA